MKHGTGMSVPSQGPAVRSRVTNRGRTDNGVSAAEGRWDVAGHPSPRPTAQNDAVN
jgi:hypothetical protein